ncbi:Sll7028 protein [hydrothermal vent metagenome]|uniref:Sll7028 protein n=1 Tax=hydrothermal vent metagenome TaxID=652676 RepID=A0A3B0YA28_9ZZZZ
MDEVEKKLSAACSSLIIDKPFLGALVLRMDLKEGDPSWCQTSGTDAKSIYYNYEYIHNLTFAQVQFVLAHEALHCALSHFSRRQHRVKHRWDLACDFAINPILISDGLTPTPDALYFDLYENMSAEEIYPLVEDNENMMTQDHHLYDNEDQQQNQSENRPPPNPQSKNKQAPDSGNTPESNEENPDANASEQQNDRNTQSQSSVMSEVTQESEVDSSLEQDKGGAPKPKPLTHEEQEQLTIQWQQRMAGAAQQAMQAGKLSGGLARLVDHLLQPQLPWRMLLAKHMTALARDDYSYTRPSKREGSAILPSLRSNQVDLVIVVDTSGSISTAEIEEFLSEVNSIKGQVKARITFHACDNVLAEGGPWEYEYWEDFSMPEQIVGGGGTSFVPVFNWLDFEAKRPDLLVYFTDADGEFPKLEPHYPVIWLVKGKSKVPWGQRIQLN